MKNIMKKNNYNYVISSLYGIVHALIDCTCAISIFGGIRHNFNISEFAFWVVMYNLIAFVLQPVIGWYTDKYKKYRLFAIMGCVFVVFGACITFTGWVSVIVFAFGNALFHVAAGSICLTLHKGKTAFVGIFTAPGDIGLVVGTLIGKNFVISPITVFWLSISFLMSIFLILIIENKNKTFLKSETIKYSEINSKLIGLTVLFLCIVIAIRAFIGSAAGFSWLEGALLAIILSVFISLGKAVGGIFADKFGCRLIGVTALLISAPLLAFLHNNVIVSLISIFIFNMTMPLTMTAIFDKIPEYPAFSFGIAAMALIPGFYAGNILYVNRIVLSLIIILAAIILYYALSLQGKRGVKVDKN